ncbi:hypothetical protein [Liquorilactobacillus hordei]|uniref:Uncharacterized protein n=1 Tax=Liquorilactobacillus hordei TaxID=468911 RepID=A0A3Q8C996_9LACO|nr:hypothetical protein [Liquorilactobacillus hordei]AUJ29594.1 hypothetical protein BSQ49_04905 [Liquorilactobacillus hordei]
MQIDIKEFLDDLPHLDSNSGYWLVRANSGDFYTDFNLNSYIGVGWNNISLKDIQNSNNSSEQLKSLIVNKNPDILNGSESVDEESLELDFVYNKQLDASKNSLVINQKKLTSRQLSSLAGQLLRFVNEIKINDLVLVPSENSEQFIVGRVNSQPFEIDSAAMTEQEKENSNYKHSNFLKRISVQWVGRFNRENADTALYKMIYSQHALSNINAYRSYINRAIFDAYILDDDELHLTYHITQEKNIDAKMLGQFIYQYSEMYESLSQSTDLKIKVNIQSKGPAESTAKKMIGGSIAFAILFCCGSASYAGGKISYDDTGKINIEMNGVAAQNRQNQTTDTANKSKKIAAQLQLENKKADSIMEREEKAYALAKKLQVPISALGIELPHRAEVALQKQLDRENKKKAHSENSEP